MEFWNDIAIDNSWKVLISLKKKYDFILIGGWATYLLTKAIKSKDIDIIVDLKLLDQLKTEQELRKTDFLRKYEMVIGEISVDIYVPFYSDFIIPIKEIEKNVISIEGMKAPKSEVLLILKQAAEENRRNSVKGQKDRIDILNLLINSEINWKNYFELIKKYKLERLIKNLKNIIVSSKKEFEYLGIRNPRKIKLLKEKLLKQIRY